VDLKEDAKKKRKSDEDFLERLEQVQLAMALRVIWEYMDRSVTKKILYGPQKLQSI
jgi:hypothetical protein